MSPFPSVVGCSLFIYLLLLYLVVCIGKFLFVCLPYHCLSCVCVYVCDLVCVCAIMSVFLCLLPCLRLFSTCFLFFFRFCCCRPGPFVSFHHLCMCASVSVKCQVLYFFCLYSIVRSARILDFLHLIFRFSQPLSFVLVSSGHSLQALVFFIRRLLRLMWISHLIRP